MEYHGTIEFGGVSTPFTVEAENATDAAYLVSDRLVDMVQSEVMTVDKITEGAVVQTFDIKTGKCIRQEFVAGDADYFVGSPTVPLAVISLGFLESLYHPFDMVQPEEKGGGS